MIFSKNKLNGNLPFADALLAKVAGLSPLRIVWAACGLIAVECLILLVVNPVFFRDSSEYITLTEAFRLGAWERAFPEHLPVLYTVLSGILAKIGIPAVSAILLVSGFFTALTVFPLYGWLCSMLSPKKAAWGVWLYALFPEIIRCGCAPLLDSGRFFFMSLALWLIFAKASHAAQVWCRLVFLGIAYAGLVLVRADGICFAAMIMVIQLCILIYRNRSEKIALRCGRILGGILLPVLIVLALATPRLVQMHRLCGCPGIDIRQVNCIRNLTGRSVQAKPVKKNKKAKARKPKVVQNQMAKDVDSLFDQPRYYRSLLDGVNILYLPFTLLGLWLLRRRKQFSFQHGMTLLLLAMYCGFHFMIQAGAGRYLLMSGVLLIPFTMEGFEQVLTWCRRKNPWFLYAAVLALVITAAMQTVRSMDNLRDRRDREYRTIRSLFLKNGPLSEARRSGQSHPVILLVGPDRGLGYYAGVNVILYDEYPRALSCRFTVDKLLQHGVSRADVSLWQTLDVPSRVNVDVIVSYANQWIPPAGKEKLFQEFDFPGRNRLRVWRVLTFEKKDGRQEKK